jgi:hypothetical protein
MKIQLSQSMSDYNQKLQEVKNDVSQSMSDYNQKLQEVKIQGTQNANAMSGYNQKLQEVKSEVKQTISGNQTWDFLIEKVNNLQSMSRYNLTLEHLAEKVKNLTNELSVKDGEMVQAKLYMASKNTEVTELKQKWIEFKTSIDSVMARILKMILDEKSQRRASLAETRQSSSQIDQFSLRIKTLEDLVAKLGNSTLSDRNRNASEIEVVSDLLVQDLFSEVNNLRDEITTLTAKVENCLNLTKTSSLTSPPIVEDESTTTREEMEKMKLEWKKMQFMAKLNGKSKLTFMKRENKLKFFTKYNQTKKTTILIFFYNLYPPPPPYFNCNVNIRFHRVTLFSVPKSCQDYFDLDITQSGFYQIDPSGSGIGSATFQVFCNFESGQFFKKVSHVK